MKKVLIVDDEKNIRIALSRCLKKEGYNITLAKDGFEAFDIIKDQDFDLILIDYQMPKKNGIEVLRELREKNIKTNAIIMTAYGTIDIAVDTMKLGAVDFISKPFELEKIKNIVKNNINNSTKKNKTLDEYILEAKDLIKKGELEKARSCLKEAILIDTSSAKIQNLLGVVEEKMHNKSLAQKYYRAALSLDATYTPADNNLKRTVLYSYSLKGIDLG
ncbi:MAG: response regulator [Clostridium baratii]|uniref:Stage 0 sporulation protein A homolog n=1 Tax=Clostridium baratii str. Sullivan TaxID=1415775 RepID=A0A0A7FYQ2_9CLOT|nr:response regulator [Clostridium baratii]AIY84713.1 tetratricopeptide repeat family protein [Clostridium baratii str. Sullivan]MBS6006312.1 response regulator [Clostridium baratii]MDU1054012.1 response regulator [Clostridium baratii]MDU4912623.1 response regulator [Clostridium baratii]CUO86649.1 response regulator with CheY-like receiver%2C AAA-type ATPase%2C and DNA-binding domains [Clostridium baratii]